MNSTPNAKDDLIASADEQIARAYERIANADEQLARMSERFSKIERDAVPDPSVGSEAQPNGRLARRRLVGLLSVLCIVGVGVVLQSSHGSVMLIGAQWLPQLTSTPLPSENRPFPLQPDTLPVQVTAAEAEPRQATPLSPTGPQDAATAASAASTELTKLLQKMTGDIANLEQAIQQLKAKQDEIASDNTKAIEQLKTKQEEMARLLSKVSEQSALPKTSAPSTAPSPQARMQPQAPPPRRQYPPRWQYPSRWQYYDEW
jgi:hypothetical protein